MRSIHSTANRLDGQMLCDINRQDPHGIEPHPVFGLVPKPLSHLLAMVRGAQLGRRGFATHHSDKLCPVDMTGNAEREEAASEVDILDHSDDGCSEVDVGAVLGWSPAEEHHDGRWYADVAHERRREIDG